MILKTHKEIVEITVNEKKHFCAYKHEYLSFIEKNTNIVYITDNNIYNWFYFKNIEDETEFTMRFYDVIKQANHVDLAILRWINNKEKIDE